MGIPHETNMRSLCSKIPRIHKLTERTACVRCAVQKTRLTLDKIVIVNEAGIQSIPKQPKIIVHKNIFIPTVKLNKYLIIKAIQFIVHQRS